jgi:uncharacterized membrane protein
MALLYLVAGAFHFIRPQMYLAIMPPWLPAPLLLVYLSGAAEILLGGSLLVPALRRLAAWGVIALLVAVFPANIYMYRLGGARFGTSDWILLLRLPLQGVLIAWAYLYTRP